MRLAWLTDLHLNFVTDGVRHSLLERIRAETVDAVLVGGDTGEAPDVARYLTELSDGLNRPVYFVLGNHDFYRGSIGGVRTRLRELCRGRRNLFWLPSAGVVRLTDRTALVGHDGWGDAGYGNAAGSDVILNDYFLIEELRDTSPEEHLATLQALGQEAAGYFRAVLPSALKDYREVIALTHVPPFREACWHEGRLSDDDWLPFFACRAVGDVLREIMADHPRNHLTVLCGHTHGSGACEILPNLTVHTGGAVYGKPCVQGVYDID